MKYFCSVKQAMLKFERQTVSKLALNKDYWFHSYEKSYEDNIYRIATYQLSEELKPLVKVINLQLNCFEKSLVKEMKVDLKYVMSLKDVHVYENEILDQNSSLENKDRCLKKTIAELLKQIVDVKDEMTKRCAQYEKDFAKVEAHYISLELKSQNQSLTSL
ncbi:hypothetical protein Tco_0798914 [Tanacetum coccineum]